jgi:DNA-binding MurR/RpiR family transcriptional regulator
MSDHGEFKTPSEEPASLASRIFAALPTLSRKQKRIARFVLDNQEFVAFSSAAELGVRTGSSAATVVRLCQALNYDGYLHLQMDLREGISFQRTAIQRLENRLAALTEGDDILGRVFATDIHNLELTMVMTGNEAFQEAVAEMRRARRILVVADGLAAGLAMFFAHALQVIGLPAHCVTGGGEPLALGLAFLQPDDLIIGIGFWRNLRDIVQAVRQAAEMGAKSIGLTDNRLSPLARLPDFSFVATTDGVAHSLSPVGVVSLLNAFLAALSLEMPEQVGASLRRVDEAYRRSDLLTE